MKPNHKTLKWLDSHQGAQVRSKYIKVALLLKNGNNNYIRGPLHRGGCASPVDVFADESAFQNYTLVADSA